MVLVVNILISRSFGMYFLVVVSPLPFWEKDEGEGNNVSRYQLRERYFQKQPLF